MKLNKKLVSTYGEKIKQPKKKQKKKKMNLNKNYFQ